MALSSIGVGSGLPLADLLANLRVAEEQPLTALATRRKSYDAKLSAYGTLKSSIESLQKAAGALKDAATFTSKTATSSNTSALSASIKSGSTAAPGQYSIDVLNLATTQTLTAKGVINPNEANGSGGILTITIDNEPRTLTLEANQTSLNGLRDAINAKSKELGVTATIVNDGSASPYRLVLTANETGTKAEITAISSDNTELNAIFGYQKGATATNAMAESVKAQDAKLKLNGIDITSSTNTLDSTIEGVTLQLLAPTAAGAPLTLKIEDDNSVALKAAKDYVTAYNALQSTISRQTAYSPEANTGSALTGDSTVRNIQMQSRNVLTNAVQNGGISRLKEVGLSTTLEGNLELDEAAFTAALADSPETVMSFFTGDQGLAKLTDKFANTFIHSDGALESVTTGIKSSIRDLEKRYESLELRIEDTMARYQTQFAALDSMMAQMQSTSAYLTQQLSMLASSSSSK